MSKEQGWRLWGVGEITQRTGSGGEEGDYAISNRLRVIATSKVSSHSTWFYATASKKPLSYLENTQIIFLNYCSFQWRHIFLNDYNDTHVKQNLIHNCIIFMPV